MGTVCVAETSLRPVGKVKVGVDVLEAVAEHGMLDAGATVVVVGYRGNELGVSGRPVVLAQHYHLMHEQDWGYGTWTSTEMAAFYDVIKDYNVVGVFTGHNHPATSRLYEWNGIQTFVTGMLKEQQFLSVNIKDDRMLVAAWKETGWTNSWEIAFDTPTGRSWPSTVPRRRSSCTRR